MGVVGGGWGKTTAALNLLTEKIHQGPLWLLRNTEIDKKKKNEKVRGKKKRGKKLKDFWGLANNGVVAGQ